MLKADMYKKWIFSGEKRFSEVEKHFLPGYIVAG